LELTEAEKELTRQAFETCGLARPETLIRSSAA
jgi:hypothetical protein